MATVRELLDDLLAAEKTIDAEAAVLKFERSTAESVSWLPVGGRENNRGQIEVASDAARSAIERVTNALDAVLELEHQKHNGLPVCRSPREAAESWLGVPGRDGLAGLTQKQRQNLARLVRLQLREGDGTNESRYVRVTDQGIGISPPDIPQTILSLGGSNKIQKHYLAGTYGQGGLSTFNFSKCSLIVTRRFRENALGFTVVKYLDLDPNLFKTGHYVYLAVNDAVPTIKPLMADIDHGTIVIHFGYDVTKYSAALGPRSLYGALNRVLFDPVAPLWFENHVRGYNRVIKGSRSALNGAVDQEDDQRGPSLDHSMPIFNITLGDYGQIALEYWVLSQPEKASTKPSESFVDPGKPIVLTHNGQNQGELPALLIRRDADLPYLRNRLIVHVSCDGLTGEGKRLLFSSTREQSREGYLADRIASEVVSALRSDEVLEELNARAREQSLKEEDQAAEKRLQRQVAKLLDLVGPARVDTGGASRGPNEPPDRDSVEKRGQKRGLDPIHLSDPPTFLRILWEEGKVIGFFPGQRRYLRLETDAGSEYHDPNDPQRSRLNVILGPELVLAGSSPLKQGRMRLIVECATSAPQEAMGGIRVELFRRGLSSLTDERNYRIVVPPPPKSRENQASIPQFKIIPVNGPGDSSWSNISESSEDNGKHALSYQYNQGVLYVYYNLLFPKF
jgi:hypothetical protein